MGSQTNLITSAAVRKLGLKSTHSFLSMEGVTAVEHKSNSKVILQIDFPNLKESCRATFHIVPRITRRLPNKKLCKEQFYEFSNLQLADPNFNIPGDIEALFGLGIWIKIVQPQIVVSENQLMLAHETKLGYVMLQCEDETHEQLSDCVATIAHLSVSVESSDNEKIPLNELNRALTRFWEMEEMPRQHFLSDDEKYCINHFQSTHFRRPDGRYVVKMPLNEKIALLGRSKQSALKQFFSIEQKMKRNQEYRYDYIDFMKKYEENGFMTKINEDREDGYYTPHHGVYSSSKFCTVFNASAPTSTGISLNECQLVGPKLQNDLAVTLMRFRTHKIALSADVKAMYCQVEIDDSHKKYQKILWRNSPKKPVGVYLLNRVAYGQSAAPHLAIMGMQQCAKDHIDQHPTGANQVLNSFYVDDMFTGADTVQEATLLYKEITAVLEKGQFVLAKWCSNAPKLNAMFKITPTPIEIKDEETKSVLGLQWLPVEDVLAYKPSPKITEEHWTKRKILSAIGKLYDPNGFIAPIVITAKIFIQTLWRHSLDWDEPVPHQLMSEWENFMISVNDISEIRIPRWLQMTGTSSIELHGFCDASEKAFAAVVYIRTISQMGDIASNIVQSKTRVAKLGAITIPRLELCGAHLLSQLMASIAETLPNRPTVLNYWCDSEIVLHWIKKSPADLKTYVANRVASIQRDTTEIGHSWKWVSTKENPADLASRGVLPSQLTENSLWWHGPSWLLDPVEKWPKSKLSEEPKEVYEEVKLVHVLTKQEQISELIRGPWYQNVDRTSTTPLFDTYGDYMTLVKTMALIQRAVHNFKAKTNPFLKAVTGPISAEEKETAKLKLCQMDQKAFLSNEFRNLQNEDDNIQTNADKTIWFDNRTGLLRLFGRAISENLTFDEQFPIILSVKGKLAPLLLRHIHQRTLHGAPQQMLQMLRQQFWIFNGRRLAQSIYHACTTCFRYRFKAIKQLMATLPTARTTPGRPFKTCGVDYMGPVGVASRTGRLPVITKAYVCLFICFATRAIHLELVSDASTAQFMQALRRFIARRGPITDIWSDNGTNFVGANSFLKNIAQKQQIWADGKVAQTFNIKWHFIIPNAPSWGGLWEAGVKSVKKHLIRVIGAQNLTFEEYATLLAQVEACVNSRPIAPLSDDPNDLNALTPGHFLVGENLVTLQEHCNLADERVGYLKRWEMVQQLYQNIWKRWHSDYISSLMLRAKWRGEHRNLQTNDLVVIYEENLPPSRWRLGRVIEIYPSKDGLVRAVKLRTKDGEYVRPITKLGLLLLSDEDPHALTIPTEPEQPCRGNVNNILQKMKSQPRVKLTRLAKKDIAQAMQTGKIPNPSVKSKL